MSSVLGQAQVPAEPKGEGRTLELLGGEHIVNPPVRGAVLTQRRGLGTEVGPSALPESIKGPLVEKHVPVAAKERGVFDVRSNVRPLGSA